MPNWCGNKLTISGRRGVLACLDQIKGEPDKGGDAMDFDKIVPMPDILKESESSGDMHVGRTLSDDEYALECLLFLSALDERITDVEGLREDIRARFPKAEEMDREALYLIEETGYPNWYEWRIAKWGCKWNASNCSGPYDPTDTHAAVQFATPGGPPCGVIFALSEQFPDLRFTLTFWGDECPEESLTIRAGKVLRNAQCEAEGIDWRKCGF